MRTNEIIIGDVLTGLRELPDESVHTVVTSPPYWGLRDYGVPGQIGLEATPQEYVTKLVGVFREVLRVLRQDGTLWLNLGDTYAQSGRGDIGDSSTLTGSRRNQNQSRAELVAREKMPPGLKPKDLVGVPWRVAFALQADGWYLRSDIIWAKPNCMPESVTDRPTKAHEYLFLMSKSERYFYDAEAIKEPYQYGRDHHRNVDSPPVSQVPGAPIHSGLRRSGNKQRKVATQGQDGRTGSHLGYGVPWQEDAGGRNKRSVWTVSPMPFPDAHFATFPEALIEPCILAGSPAGGIVLDPFMGAGTTALVALKAGRKFMGIELNPEYAAIAEKRIWQEKNQARLA